MGRGRGDGPREHFCGASGEGDVRVGFVDLGLIVLDRSGVRGLMCAAPTPVPRSACKSISRFAYPPIEPAALLKRHAGSAPKVAEWPSFTFPQDITVLSFVSRILAPQLSMLLPCSAPRDRLV